MADNERKANRERALSNKAMVERIRRIQQQFKLNEGWNYAKK